MSLHSPSARSGAVSPFRPMFRVLQRRNADLDWAAPSAKALSPPPWLDAPDDDPGPPLNDGGDDPRQAVSPWEPWLDEEALSHPDLAMLLDHQPFAFLAMAARTVSEAGSAALDIIEDLHSFATDLSQALAVAMSWLAASPPAPHEIQRAPSWLSSLDRLSITATKRRRFDEAPTMSYLVELRLPGGDLGTLHLLSADEHSRSVWMLDEDLAWTEPIMRAAGPLRAGGYRHIKPETARRAMRRSHRAMTGPSGRLDAHAPPLMPLVDFVARLGD